jgi:hypothetical protein
MRAKRKLLGRFNWSGTFADGFSVCEGLSGPEKVRDLF